MPAAWRLALTKIVATLAGGIAGWVVFLFMDLLSSNPNPMPVYGGIVGGLLGGTLAGGKIGFVGWSLLVGTACGIALGVGHVDKGSPPWGLIGAIAGMTLGIMVGVVLEVKYRYRNPRASVIERGRKLSERERQFWGRINKKGSFHFILFFGMLGFGVPFGLLFPAVIVWIGWLIVVPVFRMRKSSGGCFRLDYWGVWCLADAFGMKGSEPIDSG